MRRVASAVVLACGVGCKAAPAATDDGSETSPTETDGQGTSTSEDEDTTVDSSTSAWDDDEFCTFEDPNLEVALRKQLELPDGPISLEGTTFISIDGFEHPSITSLKGLECAKDLRGIGIRAIASTLSLAPLSEAPLDYLDTYDVPLVDLDRLSVESFEFLSLHKTELSSLDSIVHLNPLWLSIGSNPVSDVSRLGEMERIETLTLADLPAGDLSSVAKLSSLATVGIVRCPFADLSQLSGLPMLSSLFVDESNVSSLDLTDVPALEDLTVSNANLTDISNVRDISPVLRRLHVGGNDLNEHSVNVVIPELCELGWEVIWTNLDGADDGCNIDPDRESSG